MRLKFKRSLSFLLTVVLIASSVVISSYAKAAMESSEVMSSDIAERIVGKWKWKGSNTIIPGRIEFRVDGTLKHTFPLPFRGEYTIKGNTISFVETTYGTKVGNKGVITFVSDEFFTVVW